MKKLVWIRSDIPHDPGIRKEIVTSSLEHNFLDIIVREEDKKTFEKLGKFNVLEIDKCEIKGPDLEGIFIEIRDQEDCQRAWSFAEKYDFVVVSALNWKVIPLENLIAQFQGSGSSLLVEVANVQEARLFFETLEVGADGVVLCSQNLQDISDLRKLLDETEGGILSLVSAKITRITPLDSGDRVCIDCCSQMKVGEGMLVGSGSNGLFLIHSESVESEYVAARPFRVNAGPVHSYIMAPGNRTRYLSELKAGDKVLVVDVNGGTKSAVLGRVKIETRPLVLIEAECEGKSYNVIVQNAETIRLVSQGIPRSITELKKGDSVLIYISDSARHFGMKIQEKIVEK